MLRERFIVADIKGLTVVDALCTSHIIVGQQVESLQFLSLILSDHVNPGFDDLVLLYHLVAELARICFCWQHYQVVDACGSLVLIKVEVMTSILRVRHGKLGFGRLTQRQIDSSLGAVGNSLGIRFAA